MPKKARRVRKAERRARREAQAAERRAARQQAPNPAYDLELIRGQHYDTLVVDDPHNIAEAATQEQRDATLRWFTEASPISISGFSVQMRTWLRSIGEEPDHWSMRDDQRLAATTIEYRNGTVGISHQIANAALQAAVSPSELVQRTIFDMTRQRGLTTTETEPLPGQPGYRLDGNSGLPGHPGFGIGRTGQVMRDVNMGMVYGMGARRYDFQARGRERLDEVIAQRDQMSELLATIVNTGALEVALGRLAERGPPLCLAPDALADERARYSAELDDLMSQVERAVKLTECCDRCSYQRPTSPLEVSGEIRTQVHDEEILQVPDVDLTTTPTCYRTVQGHACGGTLRRMSPEERQRVKSEHLRQMYGGARPASGRFA